MYRDHDTHEPVSYYNKLPTDNPVDVAYVLDPMLATGGSALVTIEAVKAWGVKQIKFIGLMVRRRHQLTRGAPRCGYSPGRAG